MSEKILSVNDQNFESEISDHIGFALVDFWAKWCGPCKSLMPYLEQLLEVKKGEIKICKFDIDDGTKIPSKYMVQSVPTLIIFQNGKEIARKTGMISNLLNWVDSKIIV